MFYKYFWKSLPWNPKEFLRSKDNHMLDFHPIRQLIQSMFLFSFHGTLTAQDFSWNQLEN
jgi:hypothetical protein